MVEVTNFSKAYGDFLAVDDISFRVERGEILALLGPNGAGKSTTIKSICCFLAPSKGDIRILGKSVRENPDEVKKMIGYLPESAPLYGDMLVYDFLSYVAQIKRVEDSSKKVLEIADLCGIKSRLSSPIGNLSKGLKQRVGIAQALLGDPEILILDEPTSGLDPNQISEVRSVIREIGKKKTVILSTHILSEVEATCDRSVILNKGKIVLDGSVRNLFSMQNAEVTLDIDLLDANEEEIRRTFMKTSLVKDIKIEKNKELVHLELTMPASGDYRREVYDLVKRQPWILVKFQQRRRSLEEIFRDLTL